ncbi:DUF6538 domain-containing protein [Agaribacterium sp. ZY112]|uniref:DUF6538 domain-containing protein n=1 Tax=Agaribacterium sp. ZY112 TaxID=3233574 RepID=UPI0035266BCA
MHHVLKRDRKYYFNVRIPKSVNVTRPEIRLSLRTSSRKQANLIAAVLSIELNLLLNKTTLSIEAIKASLKASINSYCQSQGHRVIEIFNSKKLCNAKDLTKLPKLLSDIYTKKGNQVFGVPSLKRGGESALELFSHTWKQTVN